ncbi:MULTISPECIES: hypothetical protein [Bacillaceae]|uniref:Uncharacterized protein n=1 Tax=Evansella alkalicola TaxID=745819 RepID=A0ABS6JTF9_9BACI|nr:MULTISPECIES: hypothetical protein [Bacillaceae]MBU9721871.1 hypothetical protein [Bacillus alkalicola]
MKKLLNYIGIGLFVGWSIAILVNFSIYQHTTTQATLLHPIFDAILFMGIMVGIYFLSMRMYQKKEAAVSILLTVLGAASLVFALILYV